MGGVEGLMNGDSDDSPFIGSSVHTFLHSFIHSFIHLFVPWFAGSLSLFLPFLPSLWVKVRWLPWSLVGVWP